MAQYFFNIIEMKGKQVCIRTYVDNNVKYPVCPKDSIVYWTDELVPKKARPALALWTKTNGHAPFAVVKGMSTSMRLPVFKDTEAQVYALVTSLETMIGGKGGSYGWFLNTRSMITMPEPADISNKILLSVTVTAAKSYPYLQFEVEMPMSGMYKAVQALHNHSIKNVKYVVTKTQYLSLAWPEYEKKFLTLVSDHSAYRIQLISDTTPSPSGKLKLEDVLQKNSIDIVKTYGEKSILVGSICGSGFFVDRYVSTWWGYSYSGVSSPIPLGETGWYPGCGHPVQEQAPEPDEDGKLTYELSSKTQQEFLAHIDKTSRERIKSWSNPILLTYTPTFHLEGDPIVGRTFSVQEDGTMRVYESKKVKFGGKSHAGSLPLDDPVPRNESDEESDSSEEEKNESVETENEDSNGQDDDGRDEESVETLADPPPAAPFYGKKGEKQTDVPLTVSSKKVKVEKVKGRPSKKQDDLALGSVAGLKAIRFNEDDE